MVVSGPHAGTSRAICEYRNLPSSEPPRIGGLLYRVTLRDTVCRVIVSFRHKGLEQRYRDGSKRGLEAAHVPKLMRILSALDVAQTAADLAIPSFRTHPLKGDLTGLWSIWVNGNWRVTFRFVENDVELVDYQDYH
jgi:toxin HigB-1